MINDKILFDLTEEIAKAIQQKLELHDIHIPLYVLRNNIEIALKEQGADLIDKVRINEYGERDSFVDTATTCLSEMLQGTQYQGNAVLRQN